jgi:hypothetical protein
MPKETPPLGLTKRDELAIQKLEDEGGLIPAVILLQEEETPTPEESTLPPQTQSNVNSDRKSL